MIKKQTEIVVVGSGPGGASVARQLARAGKKVILLERGRDERGKAYYGTYLGALMYTDRHSFLFSKEGLNIIRPLMVGGATSMYCGSAARPPAWLKENYHIDLEQYVEETIEELGIAPLPAEHRGIASTRIAEAALDLGYDWQPMLKFMRPGRIVIASREAAKQSQNRKTEIASSQKPLLAMTRSATAHFDCGAKCMLGCRCRAKWNAGEWVDDAIQAGAELMTEAHVDDLIIENKQIGGVRGKQHGQPFEIEAKVVVLAAGGLGTPIILQRAGFLEAGRGITMDTTAMMYGATNEKGIGDEPPMTWGYADDEIGYLLSTLIDPWLLYPMITALKGARYPFTWYRYGCTLGVMIKIKDDITGGIAREGEISKPMSERDHFRLNHAAEAARKILLRAGADAESIFMTPLRGTHPSGTVRVCEMLDQNLQTEIKNLFVCDASVFPEALDRPTVLTILGFGKRLAEHLVQDVLRGA